MAGSVRAMLRLNLNLFSKSFVKYGYKNGTTRLLFSEASLGLQGYANARSTTENQFFNVKDIFRKKMTDLVDDANTSKMIFTEDLKVMLHLLDRTPEDMELIVKMIKKFNSQNKELRFGSFVFGPVTMRAFHYLNEPDIALASFKDPELEGFFDQVISFQVLLDLLYNNKRYDDVKSVYDIIKAKFIDGVKHPKNCTLLYLAACYKQNTPENLESVLNLLKEFKERGTILTRRSVVYMAALALAQNAPTIALELVCMIQQQRYISIRCIKAAAYSDLDRVDDVVPIFRASIENEQQWLRKETYFKDTIEKVEAAMARANVSEDSEIAKLLHQIKTHNYVNNQTFDDYLSATIVPLVQTERDRMQLDANSPFNRRNRFRTGILNAV